MEPQFIFNADDFGPVDFINEGIYYAVRLGVVNSVQVIVNGDTEESLKTKLKKLESHVPAGRTVDVGIHFTLTSGAPLHGDTEVDKARLWKNMAQVVNGKTIFQDYRNFYHGYNQDVNRHDYRKAIHAELELQRDRLKTILEDINFGQQSPRLVFSSVSNHHNIFSVNDHLLETYLEVAGDLAVRSLKALPAFKSNLYYDFMLPLISSGDKRDHRKRMDTINDAFQRNAWCGEKELLLKSPSYIDISYYRSLGSVSVMNFFRGQKINGRVNAFYKMCEDALRYHAVKSHDPSGLLIIEFVFHLGLLNEKGKSWKELTVHYPGIEPGYFEDRTLELSALEKLVSDSAINQVFVQTASWRECGQVKYSPVK